MIENKNENDKGLESALKALEQARAVFYPPTKSFVRCPLCYRGGAAYERKTAQHEIFHCQAK